MTDVFLKIVNMSISASWLVLAVLVLRFGLKTAPKWVNVLLWGIVAVRLLCPVSIESVLSLIPSAETISPGIMMDATPTVSTGIPALNSVINPVITESFAPKLGDSANPLQIWIPVASVFWIAGMVLMALYTIVSYCRLHFKVNTAVLLRENIFQSENVTSPFVLGILRPRIYLPFSMEEPERSHVIAHEMTHIYRKDHWWKPLGFLLLTVHWFNPFVWVAYILLCRDIELACDEKVISGLGNEQRADYTQALLECSVGRRMIAACPLAFGEVGVKERVRNVMNYRKPGFWMVLIAVMVCIAVAVCFLTDPPMPSLEVLPEVHSHTYFTNVIEYENETLHYSGDVESIPERFAVTEEMKLLMYVDQFNVSYTGWIELGTLKPVKLTTQNFDEAFHDFDLLASKFRKDNARAWRLMTEGRDLYILLQQKNGQMYLAIGDTNHGREKEPVIRWMSELAIDVKADYGIYAQSGENAVPLTIFPAGTAIGNYAEAVRWLTIDPGEDLVPFRIYQNGEEVMGHYICYDTETYEPVPYLVPSGLAPQTYLFQNCDPEREYIVVMIPSTEADTPIYAFGVRFAVEPTRMTNLEYYLTVTSEGVHKIIVTADREDETYTQEGGVPYQMGDQILLNLLTGNPNLDGVGIRAFDAEGKQLWDIGIYGNSWGPAEKVIEFDDCYITPVLKQEQNPVLQAKVVEVHDTHLLVQPVPGSQELSSANLIEVPMENMDVSPEAQVGDTLRIEYDGQLLETYPARIATVYRVSVVEEQVRMINMSGIIFIDTGEAVPVEIDPRAILGTLHTQVEGRPKNHGQGNFDCEGCQFAWLERDIVVLIDNEWYRFTEEVLTSPEYYLTIGKEGAVFIEVTSGARTELICKEDLSAYELGESVLLPVLTGRENLRGVTVTVRDADNSDIFSVSVSAREHGTADGIIECDDWIITPVK